MTGRNTKRILVVDDECLVADTLGTIFRKQGYDARVAYNVDDALDCIAEFEPSLVLCDITMPGKDGLVLMCEIARQQLSCGILVLTGYIANLKPVREQSRKMPQPIYVLTKPCPPEDLLREATRMLAMA